MSIEPKPSPGESEMKEGEAVGFSPPPDGRDPHVFDFPDLEAEQARADKAESELHAIRFALLGFTPDDDPDMSTLKLAQAAAHLHGGGR